MNDNEISNVCLMVYATYPHYFEGYDERGKRAIQKVWNAVLADYDYQTVCAGLKAYMANDTKGVPPVPGQIIDYIRKMSDSEISEGTAWDMTYRAMCNGIYHAKEEFNKLPPVLQTIIGTADVLRQWAQNENVNSTEQRFRIMYRRYQEDQRIPENIRKIIAGITLKGV